MPTLQEVSVREYRPTDRRPGRVARPGAGHGRRPDRARPPGAVRTPRGSRPGAVRNPRADADRGSARRPGCVDLRIAGRLGLPGVGQRPGRRPHQRRPVGADPDHSERPGQGRRHRSHQLPDRWQQDRAEPGAVRPGHHRGLTPPRATLALGGHGRARAGGRRADPLHRPGGAGAGEQPIRPAGGGGLSAPGGRGAAQPDRAGTGAGLGGRPAPGVGGLRRGERRHGAPDRLGRGGAGPAARDAAVVGSAHPPSDQPAAGRGHPGRAGRHARWMGGAEQCRRSRPDRGVGQLCQRGEYGVGPHRGLRRQGSGGLRADRPGQRQGRRGHRRQAHRHGGGEPEGRQGCR